MLYVPVYLCVVGLRAALLLPHLPLALTVLLAIPILGEWPAAPDWPAIIVISVGVYIVCGGPLPAGRA